MRVWVVCYHGGVVGCYSSAVDAQCVQRALEGRGCRGATVTVVRLNCESENGAALLRTHLVLSKPHSNLLHWQMSLRVGQRWCEEF